ncbi:hypothetical protein GIB67_009790 [Kingdonia uniflora]|uniref:DUF1985 domain-containing protein n=1 Tax=Kingdonia uniflora TaxID=39325 RepID=A0A7J7LXH7_9MAGN|nr:hypothetical protein GIB67_009790 [Kingdonia uniflora]
MKSDREVNEQFEEDNQTQESGAKKGTSNSKNYTSRCTGLGLHKMFADLPKEKKCALRTTCFALLLLIDPIVMMSTLVVEIFDRHLGDMKLRRFPKKKNTYGLKEIDDALKQAKLERHHDDVLRLNLLKIILSFLPPNKGKNVWVKYVDLVDDLQQFNKFPWGEQAYNLLWSQKVEFVVYQSVADKKSDKALLLHGCTWVLMIWTFLSIPSLKFPRIEESIHLFPKLQGWRMTSLKRRQIVTFKFFFANP